MAIGIALLAVVLGALVIGALVGRRNARAGIDWSGSDMVDGQESGVKRPRTLRDHIGIERWGDLLPVGLYVALVLTVLAAAIVAFFVWREAALVILVALGAQGDALKGGYQLVVWALGVALFVAFTIAQRGLHVAWQAGRLWQRFAAFAAALGAVIAAGWLLSVVLG